MKKNSKEMKKNMKGENMRKNFIKMMVVAGAAALIIPTAAMAEWDQSEDHNNQEDHDAMINVYTAVHTLGDFAYGMESAIGYDYKGDGTAVLATDSPYKKAGQAPWNTTPCPIQLGDVDSSGDPYTWEESMGNCPAQAQPNGWLIGQTNMGWKEGDNELFGVILDDLYQSLSEEATTGSNENGEPAFKKVDQVLDILFYRANTIGEVFNEDGWTDANNTLWYGGFGLDQTLDQDVADIEGTSLNPATVPFGTALWNYDHLAQTFYQDFRMWDRGNSFGGVGDMDADNTIDYKGGTSPGLDYVNLSTETDKVVRGNSNPRNRHGMELLILGEVWGQDSTVAAESAGDYAFFDQWVIQSLRDSYELTNYDGNGPATGVYNFTSNVKLEQSYSSWMSQGETGVLCDNVNSILSSNNGVCSYTYKKEGHAVNKGIDENSSTHQTGDP